LVGQKIDTRVASIILAECAILQKIEIMADKTKPEEIEKIYEFNKKGLSKADNKDIKKISQNTVDTFTIMDGIGRNMRKGLSPNDSDDFGSMLSYVHIMNIKINKEGWK